MYDNVQAGLARSNAIQSGGPTPRDASATDIITRELDESISRLKDLCGRQTEMLDRLFGAPPTGTSGSEKSPQMPGTLGAINDQLMFLRVLTSQVLQNQLRFEKLG